MTSVRVDTGPLIAGACVVSAYAGHGIRGADVPSTGLNGAGPIYGCITLPADADVELRLLVETVPAGLTSFGYGEADDVLATGPDGAHVGAGRLFADGVDRGAVPITITFGSGTSLGGDAALDGIAAGGGVSTAPAVVSGGATLDGIDAGGQVQGYVEPSLLIGPRTVIVGKLNTPTKLDALDLAEVEDITFRFHKMLRTGERLIGVSATAEASIGIDPNTAPLVVAGSLRKASTDAQLRVDGALAVPGVTYLLRCTAIADSGRHLVGAALLKVRRQS